jgi:hypothetical protein
MPDTEPTPTPLVAVPDRPDPDDIVSSAWGDWVHDNTLRTLKLRAVTIPNAVFDANGLHTLNAADVGLATLDGLVWNVHHAPWNPTSQPVQPIAGMAYRASPTAMVLVLNYYSTPSSAMAHAGATTVTELHVVAWGTVP